MHQPDGDRLQDHPGYAVKRLQLALRIATDAAVATAGLTTAQFAVLRVLLDTEPLTASELARRCFITRQSIRDVLGGLEARGLVQRSGPAGEFAARRIGLTATGTAAVTAATVEVDEVDRQMLAGLSPREQIQFVGWVNRCADNLTPTPAG